MATSETHDSERSECNGWHDAERRELAALGIGFDGRQYRYRQYRYDQCADAVNYARQDRARPGYREQAGQPALPSWQPPAAPSAPQQQQMARLGIVFDGKAYCYESYRYDRLAAALAYAELPRTLPARAPA